MKIQNHWRIFFLLFTIIHNTTTPPRNSNKSTFLQNKQNKVSIPYSL